ncbi:hypothetical protein KQI88_15360 [Alkaliphilus sp. MSJ-5]|uniref:Double zinc ribbon n=1 Tax=Alkaliphilus flagellatus TaxID=2841507 RepID=A0ABS6G5M6_9FIRM|nr:hypothetical protein [Alkaliphilus flagellatus]MBU5677796.1 hypothetical protein [Alkaliphilus flagellatus]
MKICEYCETKTLDDVIQCKSCGSKEFKNICENCGDIFSGTTCPKCRVTIGKKPRICYDCGEETYLEICEHCEADRVNGKQNISIHINTNIRNAQMPYRAKKKSKSALGIISVFIIIAVIITGISHITPVSKNENNAKIQTDLSDMDILTLPGHPKFYGSYKEAKQFWRKYKKVKVINVKETIYGKHEDSLLLITTSDTANGVITKVIINFPKSNELTINDVLKVVCEYIDYDIIEKYYSFNESFHETRVDGGDKGLYYEGFHYVMKLNEEGKAVNKSREAYYQDKFAFKIGHKNNEQWTAEISYMMYKGGHDRFHPKAYNVENWDIDLSKFK